MEKTLRFSFALYAGVYSGLFACPTDKGTWEIGINVDKHDGIFNIIPEAHDRVHSEEH